jgi:hypothetical protein
MRQLSKGISDLRLWCIQLLFIPLTFLVDFSKESTRIHPIHNWITPLTTVGFPQLILMIEGLKAFLKVMHKCLLMFRFYYLRFGLFLSNDLRSNPKENFIMLWIIIGVLYFSLPDLIWVNLGVLMSIIGLIVTSR